MHPKFLTNLYRIQNDRKSAITVVNSIGLISGKPCQIGRPLLGY